MCVFFFLGGQWIQNGSLFFPRACFSVVHTHPLRRREGRAGAEGGSCPLTNGPKKSYLDYIATALFLPVNQSDVCSHPRVVP